MREAEREDGRTDGLPGRVIVSIHARGRARASDAPLNRPVAVGEGGIGMRTTLALARAPNGVNDAGQKIVAKRRLGRGSDSPRPLTGLRRAVPR